MEAARLTRAQTILEKVLGPDHPSVAQALGNLGIVQGKRGDLADAETSLTRALTTSYWYYLWALYEED